MPPTLLIGHRASGKSTLGARAAAQLGRPFIDLDQAMADRLGQSAAELVARNEERFRRAEADELARLLRELSPEAIVAVGAGCARLPAGAIYVWVRRDGWEESAIRERARLRPAMTLEAELAWMRREREPIWAEAAHAVLPIARGEDAPQSAKRLARLLDWLERAPSSGRAHTSYFVVADPARLERAERDAAWIGAAGVEIRSDLGARNTSPGEATPALWSLRSDEPTWLAQRTRPGDAIDVDVRFLDALIAAPLTKPPDSILISSHPAPGAPADADALEEAADRIEHLRPEWSGRVALKYAPSPRDLGEFKACWAEAERLALSTRPYVFLPQGVRLAWARPLWLERNVANYLPVGLSPRRFGGPEAPSPWDLQDWLPFFVGPRAERFDALIGDPVDQSEGDLWHRQRALQTPGEQDLGYLKIPIGEREELGAWLDLLDRMPIRGLSVTSPLKRAAARARGVHTEQSAVNTLARAPKGWIGLDTDERGMHATLDTIAERGVVGRIAMIGRGGVSGAIERAIWAHPDFALALHRGARQGWGDAEGRFDLIVNAAGDRDAAYDGAPKSEAWLDLHYAGVRRPPGARLHVNGAIFFEAQAEAQREIWCSGGGEDR